MLHTTPLSPTSSDSSSIVSLKQFECLILGSHKIHYQSHQQWDFITETEERPIDLSLIIPHYRAHNQPAAHRMSMYIRSERGEIKTKICRKSSRFPFFLAVHSSSTAPITLYLPSDFAGLIHLSSSPHFSAHKPKISFSAGFTNRILPRVKFISSSRSPDSTSDDDYEDEEYNAGSYGADEVRICADGHVTLRMWDVVQGVPESATKEAWRMMCRKASSKNLRGEVKSREREHQQRRVIDWDFLLED
ncbi:hypothetical protein EW146_g395 [Bondarzewia mesenterica]|uniref:DUF7330 domain-containing protein n=1 Tax=Bondarzewia mesenterica TaxID=1095465 RepID=A0A4S4M7J3_9AGAM|nr:hypothetical protein EW146_g395 [Bondarzewia mesenterica]